MTTLLTVPQVAERLGISSRTVYQLCAQDTTFPVIKFHSKCYRIVDTALDDWLLAQARHDKELS